MPEYASNGLTLISLFAGCGGSSLGYRMAGYRELLAVEWDGKAAATFRRNFPDVPVFEGDICGLSDGEALRLASVAAGELDLLDGSPPCQGFSTAGKRRMGDRRNRLFEEYVRLLRAFKPRAFIMENVGGLAKGKMRLAFAEMTLALKMAGYAVSCRLLNAWWYRVPQDRRRLIWVGMRSDLGIAPSHPQPTAKRPVTVAEALDIIGMISSWRGEIRNAMFDNKWRKDSLPSPTLTATQSPMVLAGSWSFPKNAAEHGRPLDMPAQTLAAIRPPMLAQRRPRTAAMRERPVKSWEEAESMQEVKSWNSRRLAPDRPSSVQLAARPKCQFGEPRYLTVEEAKILQGFPEWFEVEDYYLVGNSVPPPMAEAIGRHVAKLLKGDEIDS